MNGRKPGAGVLARRLHEAYRTGTTLEPPPQGAHRGSVQRGYDVQEEFLDLKLAAGDDTHVGYKIALTNRASQERMRADGPAYGHLTRSDLLPSGASIALSRTNSPLVEAEFVFEVVGELTVEQAPEGMLEEVLVAPGIEIADSRYQDWTGSLGHFDFVCDAAAASYAIMGPAVQLDELPTAVRLVAVESGKTVAKGRAEDLMGGPLAALSWLVRELDARNVSLPQGSIVFSGSLTPPITPAAGTYRTEFDELGPLEVSFH